MNIVLFWLSFMIIKCFKTETKRHIEDDYVISEFGGCVNCQTSNAKRLSSLGLCDDLIVANAETLSEDPVNFLWLVKQLLKTLSRQSDRSINREMVYRIVHSMITHPEPLDIGEMDRLTDHDITVLDSRGLGQ